MRIRPLFPLLFLALPAVSHAQTKDQRHVIAQSAALDSQAISIAATRAASVKIDAALGRYCALKSQVSYLKAICGQPAVLLRETALQATRNAAIKSVETAYAPAYVPPAPAPVPAPTPDTTPTKDTTVVVTPPPTPVPAPVPAPTPTPAPVPSPTPVPPSSTAFSHPFAPPSNGAVLAEFPRVQVDTTAPQVLRVIRTTNLNVALDTARDGDLILLPVGAKLTIDHSATKHAGWVTVSTDIPAAVIAGRTMTKALADSLNLASIVTTSNTPGLWLHDGASHIRFVAVKVEAAANLINALAWIGNNERTVATLPSFIGFDRVLFDGGSFDIKRCLRLDAATSYVINSALLGCKGNQGDSQGIVVINGAGPFLIANNRIEGGHQAIMLGGGDPAIAGQLPRDIVIRNNALCRPIAWKGVWGTKTIVEFKFGQRVDVEGNTICNVWPSGQTGVAVLLKSVNQDGGAPQAETSDITVRYNRLSCAAGGFNLAGKPEPNPAVPASRITIYGNVANSIGVAPCLGDGQADGFLVMGVNDLVIRDNWMRNLTTRSAVYFTVPQQRFVFVNNVLGGGAYGVKGDNTGSTNTLSTYAPGSLSSGNTIVPTGGVFPPMPVLP